MSHNWVEVYRPKITEEYVFQDDAIKNLVDQCVASGNMNNLMFYGVRGTGKSTLANLIIKGMKIPQTDVLKVNCSDKKIDFIRDVIIPFANTMADGDFRVVRLEEFDFLSKDAQALLRSFMEEVHDNCRFIATCNYPNRVLPELRSRFTEFNFKSPDMCQLVDRVLNILETEGVQYDEDAVMGIITDYYPDIRSIINYLESNSVNGKLNIAQNNAVAPWKEQLSIAFTQKNLFNQRKVLAGMSTDDIPELLSFLTEMFSADDKLARGGIPIIAETEYRLSFVGDAELQLASMLIYLDQVLQS